MLGDGSVDGGACKSVLHGVFRLNSLLRATYIFVQRFFIVVHIR